MYHLPIQVFSIEGRVFRRTSSDRRRDLKREFRVGARLNRTLKYQL